MAIAAIGILVLAATLSSAFPVIPANAFHLSTHREITSSALSFLKQDILKQINKAHGSADYPLIGHQFSSKYHFDGCYFKDSTEFINKLYEDVTRQGPDPKKFGLILHAAMD